ncbi:hypothetical protein V5740_01200 [Croceibacterium sp. TMG7-5b_MA50]|uniref:hypothetical protein n=1 Tax=Croceibacterium sp. TMG7-5b_MA50 TaxID=3121290 RepID=UPI003221C161
MARDSANDGALLPASARRQTLQRVQIGLLGLAAMILLVALASIIMRNAEENRALVVPQAAPTVIVTPPPPPVSDPLADAGVVPDMSTDAAGSTTSDTSNAAAPRR